MLLNCGVGEDSWKSLGPQGDQTISLKLNQSEYSLETLLLKLKLQYFGHLMQRTDSLEKAQILGKIEDRRRRERQRMKWLDGITDSMDMSFQQTLGNSEGQGSLACCGPWVCRVRNNLVTEQQTVLFSIVAVSIYIPTSSARGFPFLPTISSICSF